MNYYKLWRTLGGCGRSWAPWAPPGGLVGLLVGIAASSSSRPRAASKEQSVLKQPLNMEHLG